MFNGSANSVLIQGISGQELLSAIENLIDKKLAENEKSNSQTKRYSIQDLAKVSPFCEGTIRNHIKSGKLKAKKIGRRILIEEEDFQNALSDVKSLKYRR